MCGFLSAKDALNRLARWPSHVAAMPRGDIFWGSGSSSDEGLTSELDRELTSAVHTPKVMRLTFMCPLLWEDTEVVAGDKGARHTTGKTPLKGRSVCRLRCPKFFLTVWGRLTWRTLTALPEKNFRVPLNQPD